MIVRCRRISPEIARQWAGGKGWLIFWVPMSDLNSYMDVPGGVYLCQVSEHISCGACCGLYNVADPTFDSLVDVLRNRTETFQQVERQVEGIVAFQQKIAHRECQKRPLPEFHHCPFLGLVGEGFSRVGCLLHPMSKGNKGVDLRGMSFYGGMACRVYFCPAHHQLSAAVKDIVCRAATNWYGYGLIVTEAEMLNAFFQAVEGRIGRRVEQEDIIDDTCLNAVRAFLDLKISWPYREHPRHGLCHYFFRDNLYPRPSLDYAVAGLGKSKYDVILRALGSCFFSASRLRDAEDLIDGIVDMLATAILSRVPDAPRSVNQPYSTSMIRHKQ